jgi:hypothetical protein
MVSAGTEPSFFKKKSTGANLSLVLIVGSQNQMSLQTLHFTFWGAM